MKNVTKIIIIVFILTSCQSAKDALTLKKKATADEFLVEKKSPLVLPPEYGKLPTPDGEKIIDTESDEDEIKILVSNDNKNLSPKIEKNSKTTSIEQSILKQIK
jgi:hypothetical protein